MNDLELEDKSISPLGHAPQDRQGLPRLWAGSRQQHPHGTNPATQRE